MGHDGDEQGVSGLHDDSFPATISASALRAEGLCRRSGVGTIGRPRIREGHALIAASPPRSGRGFRVADRLGGPGRLRDTADGTGQDSGARLFVRRGVHAVASGLARRWMTRSLSGPP
jgi:hypothetical protein